MTRQELLKRECWGLIVWPLGAALAFYNGAMVATFICIFFTGVATGLACRDFQNTGEKK